MSATRSRVLLVDDHLMVRKGIRIMLSEYPEIDIVGEAENYDEAMQKMDTLRPDQVLMDINLGNVDKDGIQATREILRVWPVTQVIILSMVENETEIRSAIEAGAVGYLLKNIEGAELARALDTVRCGGSAMSPQISRKVLREFTGMLNRSSQPHEARETLSEKEQEVLTLLCQGKSNRDIGSCLFITEKTVKSHITSILRKLGVKDRTQAVIKAIQQKMVQI